MILDKEQRDLNEVKADQQPVFFTVKMRVTRKQELEGDYDMFKLYWQREIRKALNEIGDVKFLVVFT
jgi:hypothetical protein